MVKNLFEDFRPEVRRDRQISVFRPSKSDTEESLTNSKVVAAFNDVADMTQMMGDALASIEDHAETLVVPIEDDDNEVRAAHLRQGGDGKFITFAQFQNAINESKRSRTDYAFDPDLKGSTFANQRKVEQNRMVRGLQNFAKSASSDPTQIDIDLGDIGGFGLQGLLLLGLNKLIGLNHAMDHSAVTSGKYPPGAEVGGVIAQIIQALLMMKFLHGMTEESAAAYAQATDINIPGVDINTLVKESFAAPAPKGKSFDLMRAGLSTSDSELIAQHASNYASKHIGDGFETWYAYLTTREMHERGLRESVNAIPYQEGTFQGSEPRARGLTKLANAGLSELSRIQKVLGNEMTSAEACCLTRFLLAIDVSFLETARTIIEMSIAVLEAQAAVTFDLTLNLMTNPEKSTRSEVMAILDRIMEEVVDQVLDWSNLEGPVADIIRECTSVSDLFTSIIDQVEWIQDWYTQLLKSFENDTEAWDTNQSVSWKVISDVKGAKEQLRMILRMMDEREAMVEASLPESQILGIVEEMKGYRVAYKIDVNIYEQVIKDMAYLVDHNVSKRSRNAILDRIDGKLAAAGVSDADRASLRSRLAIAANEKSDTKLNEALSYVEDLVGDNGRGPVSAVNSAAREMTDWCRTVGEWDGMKGYLVSKGVLGQKVDDS